MGLHWSTSEKDQINTIVLIKISSRDYVLRWRRNSKRKSSNWKKKTSRRKMFNTKNYCKSLTICFSNLTKFRNRFLIVKLNSRNRILSHSYMLDLSQETSLIQLNSKVGIPIKILSQVLLRSNHQCTMKKMLR